jgi:hypothetical protein
VDAVAAGGGDRRRDLLVRVHVLPRLRGQQAGRALPELRQQPGATADPAGFQAREQPTSTGRIFKPQGCGQVEAAGRNSAAIPPAKRRDIRATQVTHHDFSAAAAGALNLFPVIPDQQ